MLQTLTITWKVTAAIHWEALRLWQEGLKLQPRPAMPAVYSGGAKTLARPRGPKC